MTNETEVRRQPHKDLSKDYETVRSQYHLNLDHQAYCSERAKLLLGCYRRNDANDPDVYVQAIMMVLSKYPRAIVEYVTDPRVGIQSSERFRSFPPNSGEVLEACDEELRRIHRAQQPVFRFRKREYEPPLKFPGCRANVLILAEAPFYPEVKAWSESAEADELDWRPDEQGRGVWVALSVYDAIVGGRMRGWKRPTLGEQYAAVGAAETEARRAATEAP